MESTLAATTRRFNRVLFKQLRPRKLASASTGCTADPAVHSEQGPGIYDDETLIAASQKENKPSIEKEPLVPPKPPYPPSPKLESTGVSPPIDPTTQQKRQSSTSTTAATTAAPPTPPPIEDGNCEGLDGTPWPEHTIDRGKERKEQEEYDKEYFKHHKPSPLYEVKMVDTRKPITRATDGTVEDSYYDSYYDVEGGHGVIVWRPEQLDTAEEALYRAAEIWRQNAMRGDPDSPHGKVLRMLRGENW